MDLNEAITLVGPYMALATQIIGVAAIIARFTPTPVDDGVVLFLKKILDWVAMNEGQAINANDPRVARTRVKDQEKK